MLRLAIIASHPIQYHSPWYRRLARVLDLHVYYAHRPSPEDQQKAGFDVAFQWDIPLLEGYSYSWLKNLAHRPSVDRFLGCDTPGVNELISENCGLDAVLVSGWNLLCFWQAVRSARRCRIPVLVRGDSQLVTARKPILTATKRVVYPYLLRQFDAFLSVGQRNMEYLMSYGVQREAIFSSLHSVDNDFFSTSAEHARRRPGGPRSLFGIPEGRTVYLFVGKFIRKKRPIDFLRALDLLQRKGFQPWGLLIGDGPLRSDLEDHARRYGTPCTFGGFLNQREIGTAYAASDVLVLPSDGRETWGLVVNEAMACGVPAVVSHDVGCAPDLVIDGKTGFSFPCGQVSKLADHMQRVLSDPELLTRLSRNAIEHVSRFSPDASCAGVLASLDYVVNRAKAS